MRACAYGGILMAVVASVLGVPVRALADETDNFTCRTRLTRDSRAALDVLMNAKIQEAVGRANRRGRGACGADCLFRELQRGIGGSSPEPWTLIPHARFERWIRAQTNVDRCHLKFHETIYGARAYNRPWLVPFNGRIIFVADSILLSGHVVGIDKISHFIREGRGFWRDVTEHGRDIASVLGQDLGPPRWQLGWNEHGLKGMSLTGVLAYADLAASYSGFRFWTDLLSLGRRESFVAYDTSGRRFIQIRPFTFAAYVNAAWDESVNYSALAPTLEREVAAALERRSLSRSNAACRALASLPDARLYVNPLRLGASLSNWAAPEIGASPEHDARADSPEVAHDVTDGCRAGSLTGMANLIRAEWILVPLESLLHVGPPRGRTDLGRLVAPQTVSGVRPGVIKEFGRAR